MNKTFRAISLLIITLALLGCGGGGSSSPPAFVTQILSDPVLDGDITKSSTDTYTIAQGNILSLFAGIDPVSLAESRSFLDFPLSGPGGVPSNAIIVSATIELFIKDFRSTATTIPMRIELVSFSSVLQVADYDSSPLVGTFIRFQLFQSDVDRHVIVDVTPLMEEAQRLGLANLQLRVMEDLGPVIPGLVEIEDTTGPNRDALAPLLEVAYL